MIRRVTSSIALACCLASAPLFAQSAADVETARDLFKQANRLEDAGNHKGALEKYKAAHALASTPVTGLALAKQYAQLNMLTEARETLEGVGRIPIKPDESQNVKLARADAAKLSEEIHGRIPTLTIVLTGATDGAVVTLDGNPVNPAVVGQPMRVNPGTHAIAATPRGGAPQQAQIELREKDARQVAFQLTQQETSPPPPDTTQRPVPESLPSNPPHKNSGGGEPVFLTGGPDQTTQAAPPQGSPPNAGLYTLGLVGTVTGGVVAVVGGIMGVMGLICKDDPKHCGNPNADAAKSQSDLAAAGFAMFVIGAVVFVPCFVLYTIESSKAKNAAPGAQKVAETLEKAAEKAAHKAAHTMIDGVLIRF